MGSYRPLVAIAGYFLTPDRVERWPDGGHGAPAPYVEALRRAGTRTAILPVAETGEAEELLEPFDGLLLVGGGDIEPARYGAVPIEAVRRDVDPDRDAFEIALIRASARIALPTLCICRGMQVMNVAFGGTLLQHLPDVPGLVDHRTAEYGTRLIHGVRPEPGSRLSAATKSDVPLACASSHHQGIDRLGDDLVATGRSPDGLIEAIEIDAPGDWGEPATPWMLGVQWHPERTAATDPVQQALFDALALLARARGIRAAPAGHPRGREYAISDPDPGWPARFDAEADRILPALPAGLVVGIEHVGSTSVPGLAAKPTIDILLSLRAMAPRDPYTSPLRELGYRWVVDPWDEEHEFFSRDVRGERAFHVHACLAGGEFGQRHLVFRDWLRAHPDDAAAYATLKRRLAAEHPDDPLSYTDAKTDFIRAIEARAAAGQGEPTVAGRQSG